MKVAIIDDEQHNIENLAGIINRNFPEMIIAGTAATISAAVAMLAAEQPDLVFLDIQMGAKTGFDILKALPERDFEVIFVTAYDKYGIQAIKFAALDYILKPIDEAELNTAITRAIEKIVAKVSRKQLDFLMDHLRAPLNVISKIALPLYQETRYVPIAEIIRCEALNTYVNFYLAGGERILVSKPLKEYDELLAPQGFVRCHQSHLVNMQYIKSLLNEDGACLLLKDGGRIPVSRAKKDFVKMMLGK